MPAAVMTANQNFAGLMVDQSLVDSYLARVDRFVNNVRSFEETLANMMSRPEPVVPERTTPVYQETAAAEPARDVVTADDIDLDALLSGINLNGMKL